MQSRNNITLINERLDSVITITPSMLQQLFESNPEFKNALLDPNDEELVESFFALQNLINKCDIDALHSLNDYLAQLKAGVLTRNRYPLLEQMQVQVTTAIDAFQTFNQIDETQFDVNQLLDLSSDVFDFSNTTLSREVFLEFVEAFKNHDGVKLLGMWESYPDLRNYLRGQRIVTEDGEQQITSTRQVLLFQALLKGYNEELPNSTEFLNFINEVWKENDSLHMVIKQNPSCWEDIIKFTLKLPIHLQPLIKNIFECIDDEDLLKVIHERTHQKYQSDLAALHIKSSFINTKINERKYEIFCSRKKRTYSEMASHEDQNSRKILRTTDEYPSQVFLTAPQPASQNSIPEDKINPLLFVKVVDQFNQLIKENNISMLLNLWSSNPFLRKLVLGETLEFDNDEKVSLDSATLASLFKRILQSYRTSAFKDYEAVYLQFVNAIWDQNTQLQAAVSKDPATLEVIILAALEFYPRANNLISNLLSCVSNDQFLSIIQEKISNIYQVNNQRIKMEWDLEVRKLYPIKERIKEIQEAKRNFADKTFEELVSGFDLNNSIENFLRTQAFFKHNPERTRTSSLEKEPDKDLYFKSP